MFSNHFRGNWEPGYCALVQTCFGFWRGINFSSSSSSRYTPCVTHIQEFIKLTFDLQKNVRYDSFDQHSVHCSVRPSTTNSGHES